MSRDITTSAGDNKAQLSYCLCYRVPVPGAKPYIVDLTSSDRMLRPLTLTQPSHPVPTDQIMWMVVFTGKAGKAVRKVLRDYLKVS